MYPTRRVKVNIAFRTIPMYNGHISNSSWGSHRAFGIKGAMPCHVVTPHPLEVPKQMLQKLRPAQAVMNTSLIVPSPLVGKARGICLYDQKPAGGKSVALKMQSHVLTISSRLMSPPAGDPPPVIPAASLQHTTQHPHSFWTSFRKWAGS